MRPIATDELDTARGTVIEHRLSELERTVRLTSWQVALTHIFYLIFSGVTLLTVADGRDPGFLRDLPTLLIPGFWLFSFLRARAAMIGAGVCILIGPVTADMPVGVVIIGLVLCIWLGSAGMYYQRARREIKRLDPDRVFKDEEVEF